MLERPVRVASLLYLLFLRQSEAILSSIEIGDIYVSVDVLKSSELTAKHQRCFRHNLGDAPSRDQTAWAEPRLQGNCRRWSRLYSTSWFCFSRFNQYTKKGWGMARRFRESKTQIIGAILCSFWMLDGPKVLNVDVKVILWQQKLWNVLDY